LGDADLDDIGTTLRMSAISRSQLNEIAVLIVAKLHYIKHKIQLGASNYALMIYAMPVSE
jgi:hypothetical protein